MSIKDFLADMKSSQVFGTKILYHLGPDVVPLFYTVRISTIDPLLILFPWGDEGSSS
jgi:hypothetical protein